MAEKHTPEVLVWLRSHADTPWVIPVYVWMHVQRDTSVHAPYNEQLNLSFSPIDCND